MSKVLIMMSTYNGECFLSEQIESLLKQNNEDITILVRDDGSSDKTVGILEEYEKSGQLQAYSGRNLKPARSFMELIDKAHIEEYDYYAFSDQDDIWLPDKVHVAVQAIQKYDVPAMYYCKTDNVTASLEHIDYFFRDPKYATSLQASVLTGSLIPGCTMLFNKALMKELHKYKPNYITMHDNWVHLVCLAVGGRVVADNEAYILYRQHGNNAVGSTPKTVRYRIKRLIKKENVFSKIAAEVYKGYNDEMSQKDCEFFEMVMDYKKSLLIKLKLINESCRCLNKPREKLFTEMKIILGKF